MEGSWDGQNVKPRLWTDSNDSGTYKAYRIQKGQRDDYVFEIYTTSSDGSASFLQGKLWISTGDIQVGADGAGSFAHRNFTYCGFGWNGKPSQC
jgi:hypothetical protein